MKQANDSTRRAPLSVLLLAMATSSCGLASGVAPGTDGDLHAFGDEREIWFSPPIPAGADYPTVFEPSNVGAWDGVASLFDVLIFHMSMIGDQRLPAQQLDFVMSWLPQHGKKIAIATHPVAAWRCDGLVAAQQDIAHMQSQVYDRGFEVGYLVFDATFLGYLGPGGCGTDSRQATDELMAYLEAVHAAFPEVEYVWSINFPAWTYAGLPGAFDHTGVDFHGIVEHVFERLAASPVTLAAAQIDTPWTFMNRPDGGTPHRRLVDLVQQLTGHGCPISMIVNTDVGVFPHDAAFYNTTTPAVFGGAPAPYDPAVHLPRDRQYHADTTTMTDYTLSNFGPHLHSLAFMSWHIAPYSGFLDHPHNAAEILHTVAAHARRGVCTPDTYRALRPDVADPASHWIQFGRAEGMCEPRMPSPGDPQCTPYEYLLRRPDVLFAGMDPMAHWRQHGQHEGMCRPDRPSEGKAWLGLPASAPGAPASAPMPGPGLWRDIGGIHFESNGTDAACIIGSLEELQAKMAVHGVLRDYPHDLFGSPARVDPACPGWG